MRNAALRTESMSAVDADLRLYVEEGAFRFAPPVLQWGQEVLKMSNVPYYRASSIAPRTWMIEYDFTVDEHMYSYLLEGDECALLIDTMMGWGDLRAFCETLTDKPILLVNTHAHPDHVGGNFAFEKCYIHPLDMPAFYHDEPWTSASMLESAKKSAKPEYKSAMEEDDFAPERPMITLPVWEGDSFELGGRKIDILLVGGHTPGSIVLIDDKNRICFTGDCCNGNTLMNFRSSLSVEEYLRSLLAFKAQSHRFDKLWGGHCVLGPEVIDEGIEACAKVIAGTDAKHERPGMFGRTATFAVGFVGDTYELEGGKVFNMCYDPKKIMAGEKKGRVIGLKPEPLF